MAAAAATLAAELAPLTFSQLRARFQQLFGFAPRSHDNARLRRMIVAGVVEGKAPKPPAEKKRVAEEEAPVTKPSKRPRALRGGKEVREVVEEEEAALAVPLASSPSPSPAPAAPPSSPSLVAAPLVADENSSDSDPAALLLAELAPLTFSQLCARFQQLFGFAPRSHDNARLRRMIVAGVVEGRMPPKPPAAAEKRAAEEGPAEPPISKRLRRGRRGGGCGGEDEVGSEQGKTAKTGGAAPAATAEAAAEALPPRPPRSPLPPPSLSSPPPAVVAVVAVALVPLSSPAGEAGEELATEGEAKWPEGEEEAGGGGEKVEVVVVSAQEA